MKTKTIKKYFLKVLFLLNLLHPASAFAQANDFVQEDELEKHFQIGICVGHLLSQQNLFDSAIGVDDFDVAQKLATEVCTASFHDRAPPRVVPSSTEAFSNAPVSDVHSFDYVPALDSKSNP